MVERELRVLYNKNENVNNLSSAQFGAIKELQNNDRINVQQADKGGSIVILDSYLYSSLALTTLNRNRTYRKLLSDPVLPSFEKLLEKILQEGLSLGILTQKDYNYLNLKHPVMPAFHGFAKGHKGVFF